MNSIHAPSRLAVGTLQISPPPQLQQIAVSLMKVKGQCTGSFIQNDLFQKYQIKAVPLE